LLFILSFCESLWVMIKIFFSFLHFYSPVFSHLINNTEWMNGYWVLLKKKCTHALPESPLHLFQQNVVFFMSEKKKKNLILFHPLFLSHTTIIWYCLSSVYVPFFLSGPVNNSDRMQTWGHVQSCLEIRKCQHIYITYLTSILNSYQ
jgi:hypothetical protein